MNLATLSPAGLNILRCHKALLHTVDCTTERCQEREFFLVKNVIGSIKAVTSCLSSKDSDTVCMKHLQQKLGFNVQGSAAGLSLSSAERNILLNHNQALDTVCVRCILCVLQISPPWEGSLQFA